MPAPSYPELQEKYGRPFVALRDGEVVAAGKTYHELLGALQPAGFARTEAHFLYGCSR